MCVLDTVCQQCVCGQSLPVGDFVSSVFFCRIEDFNDKVNNFLCLFSFLGGRGYLNLFPPEVINIFSLRQFKVLLFPSSALTFLELISICSEGWM